MTSADLEAVSAAAEELTIAYQAVTAGRAAPGDHLKMEQAARRYIELLTPVVGAELAMQYQTAFEDNLSAGQRLRGLVASVASRPDGPDAEDAQFMDDLGAIVADTTERLCAVGRQVSEALDRSAAAAGLGEVH